MSRKPSAPLHIEWTPDWVRAINTADNTSAEARTIAELGSILIGSHSAIVGVGHNHVFIKSQHLPKASASDLRDILSVQIGQLFPLPADQLAFDFLTVGPPEMEGVPTVVAAMRADDLKSIRVDLKQSGLTAERILPIALASAAVATRAGAPDALVAEQRQSGLALDVIQGGSLRFSRVAPIADDLRTEVQRTLAAARLADLPVVTVGDLETPGAIPSLDSPLSLLHEAPPFHFELSEDRLKETRQRVANRTRLGVLLVLAALVFVLLLWSNYSDAQALVTRSQGAWARQITEQQSITDAATTRATNISSVNDTLTTAFSPGQRISDEAAVIGDSLPKDAWLTSLNLQRGKPMEVRGTAKTAGDVTEFVDALGSSSRFRDVRLVFANSATVAGITVVQFDISAVCVANLPMPVPQKAIGRGVNSAASDSTGDGE